MRIKIIILCLRRKSSERFYCTMVLSRAVALFRCVCIEGTNSSSYVCVSVWINYVRSPQSVGRNYDNNFTSTFHTEICRYGTEISAQTYYYGSELDGLPLA